MRNPEDRHDVSNPIARLHPDIPILLPVEYILKLPVFQDSL